MARRLPGHGTHGQRRDRGDELNGRCQRQQPQHRVRHPVTPVPAWQFRFRFRFRRWLRLWLWLGSAGSMKWARLYIMKGASSSHDADASGCSVSPPHEYASSFQPTLSRPPATRIPPPVKPGNGVAGHLQRRRVLQHRRAIRSRNPVNTQLGDPLTGSGRSQSALPPAPPWPDSSDLLARKPRPQCPAREPHRRWHHSRPSFPHRAQVPPGKK